MWAQLLIPQNWPCFHCFKEKVKLQGFAFAAKFEIPFYYSREQFVFFPSHLMLLPWVVPAERCVLPTVFADSPWLLWMCSDHRNIKLCVAEHETQQLCSFRMRPSKLCSDDHWSESPPLKKLSFYWHAIKSGRKILQINWIFAKKVLMSDSIRQSCLCLTLFKNRFL